MAENFVASFEQVGNFEVRNVNGNIEKNGGNVASYFCTPDGQVINAVAGPAKPDVVLSEARWAVDVWSRMQKGAGIEADVVAAAHRDVIGSTNGNQKKVHRLLANRPLDPLEDVYPSVFEGILNEEVANVTVDLKLASQGLEAAKREGLPLLFIFHKDEDNREVIGKWSLLIAQQSRNPGTPLPKIAKSFVTVALPLDELPALSRQVGVEPYRAPNNATPLFVVTDSHGVQQNALTGWNRESELMRAMAWGLIHQAGKQNLPMGRLRSLLKLVRNIDDRMIASVMDLIRKAAETQTSGPGSLDTALLLKHAPVTPEVVSLPKIELPRPDNYWDSAGMFSVVDSGIALSLPSAAIGDELDLPSSEVIVPNVTGLNHSVAASLLRARGLTVEVPNRLARPDDIVEKQSVRGGQAVTRGARVRLDRVVTSTPDVVGMTIDAARRLLRETHGFEVGMPKSLQDDMRVTHQHPTGGSHHPRGEPVQLFNRRAMPTLVGIEISKACELMETAGIPFRLDSPTVNGDTVFRQTPEPGDWLHGDAVASLVAGVQIPDLTGSYDDARKTLTKLGILGELQSGKRTFAYRPQFPIGQQSVYWQSVEPGNYMSRSDILQVRTVTYRRRAVGF